MRVHVLVPDVREGEKRSDFSAPARGEGIFAFIESKAMTFSLPGARRDLQHAVSHDSGQTRSVN